jgi:hypothetical protein
MKKEDKKIITIQLPTNLYDQLVTEADAQMLTLSAYVRLLLIKNHGCEKTKDEG